METIKFGRLPIKQEDGTIKTVDLEWLVVKELKSYRRDKKGILRTLVSKDYLFYVTKETVMEIMEGKKSSDDVEKEMFAKAHKMFNLHEHELILNCNHSVPTKEIWDFTRPCEMACLFNVHNHHDELRYRILEIKDTPLAVNLTQIGTDYIRLSDASNSHYRFDFDKSDGTFHNSELHDKTEYPDDEYYGIRFRVQTFEHFEW